MTGVQTCALPIYVHRRCVSVDFDCVVANDRRRVVVLDVDTGVFADGQGRRAVHSSQGKRETHVDDASANAAYDVAAGAGWLAAQDR